jgi:hypothetical protein
MKCFWLVLAFHLFFWAAANLTLWEGLHKFDFDLQIPRMGEGGGGGHGFSK